MGPGEEPLIALPLTLPMGWTESTPPPPPPPPPLLLQRYQNLGWTSSIYMPPPPGTHHDILWNLPRAHSPHWMVGTASPLPHPLSRHHLDSRYCHNSPRPSNTITTDHWPMGMSSSMTAGHTNSTPRVQAPGAPPQRPDLPGQRPP